MAEIRLIFVRTLMRLLFEDAKECENKRADITKVFFGLVFSG